MTFLRDRAKLSIFILILILGLGFFFRIYKLSSVPPSLNWDEVSHGFNAYSILKTGRDEWGIKFPLIFRAYGDYKLPLYIYLTSFAEFFLGLNSYSVRLVSILSGVGLVFLSFLIAKKITKNENYGLLAAFLTAVSPLSLFLSRVAVEANLAAFLFALGICFLLSWFKRQKPKNLVLTSFFWGLSLHAYNSARILVPLFFLLVLIYSFRKKILGQILIPAIILLIFLIPVFNQILDRSAKARFNWVSLIDEGMVGQIVEKRENSGWPKVLARAIFNRPTFFAYYAGKNYVANLSLQYLFFKGGTHYQFSLPDHGLFFLVCFPFLLIGLLKAILKKSLEEKFLVLWFFLAFLPSAITKDAPHVLRSILILPSPLILTVLGVKTISDFLKNRKSIFKGKLVAFAFVIAVLISFCRWMSDYLTVYPKAYSWAWQYGYKEMVSFVRENYKKYDQIFITKRYGEPHEFILFYFPWDPKNYQATPTKTWDYHANWYWIDGFDKFVFVNDWEIKNNVKCQSASWRTNVKCLLVTSPGNYPEEWSKIKTINFLDGKPAFEILSYE